MTKLRIALQKGGRLTDDCVKLLRECGIQIPDIKDKEFIEDPLSGVQILFAKYSDIPDLVNRGVCDIGIVGQNLLDECWDKERNKNDLTTIINLGFSVSSLWIAKPKEELYPENQASCKDIKDIDGKRIATSYPNILNKFLKANGVKAQIEIMNGSVEAAIKMGIAELICDLVVTGSSLKRNNLEEFVKIQTYEAVLIGNNRILDEVKQATLNYFIEKIKRRVSNDLNLRIEMLLQQNNETKALTLNSFSTLSDITAYNEPYNLLERGPSVSIGTYWLDQLKSYVNTSRVNSPILIFPTAPLALIKCLPKLALSLNLYLDNNSLKELAEAKCLEKAQRRMNALKSLRLKYELQSIQAAAKLKDCSVEEIIADTIAENPATATEDFSSSTPLLVLDADIAVVECKLELETLVKCKAIKALNNKIQEIIRAIPAETKTINVYISESNDALRELITSLLDRRLRTIRVSTQDKDYKALTLWSFSASTKANLECMVPGRNTPNPANT